MRELDDILRFTDLDPFVRDLHSRTRATGGTERTLIASIASSPPFKPMVQVKVEFKVKRERHMMHIGEVARSVGVRASTIRYYESRGIIQPAVRSVNGYRFYRNEAVHLLAFVKRAQSLGLTLKEIKSLLELTCGDR